THGGSLRVHARPAEAGGEPSARGKAILGLGEGAGQHTVEGHAGVAGDVVKIKSGLLAFLIGAAAERETVGGSAAPGRGNTLLTHGGPRSHLPSSPADRSPHKTGLFLPGTHIPTYPPEKLAETKPDYILVLPWNLREEITQQLDYVRSWGGRLV